MIKNLILKDLRAFGTILFLFLFPFVSINFFFVTYDPDAAWWLFILIGSAQASMIISVYFALDQKYKGELLACSLPVTRKDIVISRFLFSGILALICYLFIYGSAFILNQSLNYYDFYLFTNPYMLLVVFIYFSLYISIIITLPTVFKDIRWPILVILFYLSAFILLVDKVILPKRISYIAQFTLTDFLNICFIFFITSLIVYSAYKFSVKKYSNLDI